MKFSNKLFIVFLAIFSVQNISFLFGHVIMAPNLWDTGTITEIIYEEDVPTALRNKQPTVILFYMENCNHCHSLMPFLNKKSSEMPKVKFLTVNGPRLNLPKYVTIRSKEQKQLNAGAQEFKIIGFPSIIFVKDGAIIDLQTGGSQGALADKLLKHFK